VYKRQQQLGGISTPLTISDEARKQLTVVSKEKSAYQWLRPDLLPFINQGRMSINQLDLFSESLYLVLLVRTNHEAIKVMSYLFFRNDCSNFGISDGRTKLEPSHKAIIGKMASQFATFTIHHFLKTKEEAAEFKRQTRALLEVRQLESKQAQDDLDAWKINWLETYLLERSKRDGLNYVISDSAREKLVSAQLSYEESKLIVDNCIVYICNLHDFTTGDDVVLDAGYLIITPSKESHHHKMTIAPVQGANKTILLLDRLEDAAYELQRQGLPITSADVGAHLPKAISAPAISDALRKNRVRILHLLDQYPQRWMTIRQYFKPIINLRNPKTTYLTVSR
jgi:hypothetical protein